MRPEIICHMVSSIDGRLLVDRFSPPAAGVDGARLRRHYDEVYRRFGADGWMVGRVTMEEFAHGTNLSEPEERCLGNAVGAVSVEDGRIGAVELQAFLVHDRQRNERSVRRLRLDLGCDQGPRIVVFAF